MATRPIQNKRTVSIRGQEKIEKHQHLFVKTQTHPLNFLVEEENIAFRGFRQPYRFLLLTLQFHTFLMGIGVFLNEVPHSSKQNTRPTANDQRKEHHFFHFAWWAATHFILTHVFMHPPLSRVQGNEMSKQMWSLGRKESKNDGGNWRRGSRESAKKGRWKKMRCGFRTQLSLADFGKSLSARRHSEGSQGESQRTSLLLPGLPFMCPLQLFSMRACMYMSPRNQIIYCIHYKVRTFLAM